MKKVNMKLMQGIDETEGLLKEKKSDPNGVPVEKKGLQDMKSEGGEKPPSDSLKQTSNNTKKSERSRGRGKSKKSMDRGQKQVFSFRAFLDDINLWKAYATAVGETMENIGSAAMNEYMNKHKLSGAELAIYEALKAREK